MRNIVLSFFLLIVSASSFTAAAAEVSLSGSGTAGDPYLIGTANEWNIFAAAVNDSTINSSGIVAQITADLGFAFSGITQIGEFAGELIGGGHRLSGFSCTASSSNQGALIATADSIAYIHDFTVAGSFSTTSSSAKYCGAVVGSLYGKIANVTSSVTCSGTAYYFAGVVGYAGGSATVDSCSYSGAFTASSMYTGGVVGYADSGSIVNGCSCDGTMTYTGNYEGCVVGYSNGATVSGCSNAATISASAMQTYIGGIVGYCKGGTIDGCVNNGAISNTCGYIGGIVAYADNCEVSGCINYGAISYTSTMSVYGYSGGIVAYASSVIISNCSNKGGVTGQGNNNGGIVGYAFPATISYCVNEGDISGGTYTGGIAGSANGSMTVSDCCNAGAVDATGNYTAGISAYSTGASVERCFNVGDITSAGNYAGGIVGQTYSVTDCYNAGAVSGANWVGGLAGQALSKMDNGYSTGAVTGTGENISNMNGRTNVNSNLYYLTENDASAQDDTSTGLARAQLAVLDLGDNWLAGDSCTYPRLATLAENDYAKAYAAAIIPHGDDSYSSITGSFGIGVPDGLIWDASPSVVSIEGNAATFTQSIDGTLTMTATSGDVSVATDLVCKVEVDGVGDAAAESRTLVEERFYGLDGKSVPENSMATGSEHILIVVRSYSDGTTEAVKEVR